MSKHIAVMFLAAALIVPTTPRVQAQDSGGGPITQAEAQKAASSVAKFCKTLIARMDDLIEDQWATQDLQDLAAVWASLDCHQVFGIDERIRWMLR